MSCIGCNYSSKIKEKRLKDTLEALKKLSDFRPLNSNEAYDFINRYYLPRLDTMPTKRKIFIYPLSGIDFKEIFKQEKVKLERKYYSGDTIEKKSNVFFAPPSVFFYKSFSWDSKRLLNTKVIADTAISIEYAKELKNHKIWHQKYGFGYMCISYPQYNPYTKRLVIREWIEDDDWCGTGRLKKFWFNKVRGGWKAINGRY